MTLDYMAVAVNDSSSIRFVQHTTEASGGGMFRE